MRGQYGHYGKIHVFRIIKVAIMSCIPKCKCFGCHFSEANVRNPILAKPLVWSPIIAIFSNEQAAWNDLEQLQELLQIKISWLPKSSKIGIKIRSNSLSKSLILLSGSVSSPDHSLSFLPRARSSRKPPLRASLASWAAPPMSSSSRSRSILPARWLTSNPHEVAGTATLAPPCRRH